jgi:hypothetical protein
VQWHTESRFRAFALLPGSSRANGERSSVH